MPIQFIAKTEPQQNGGTTDLVITKPAGTVAGDLMFYYHMDTFGFSFEMSAGWTAEITDLLYWKVATASEPANYTLTRNGSNPITVVGALLTYRGIKDNPTITSEQVPGPSGPPIAFNPVSILKTGALVLTMVRGEIAAINTIEPIANYTTRVENRLNTLFVQVKDRFDVGITNNTETPGDFTWSGGGYTSIVSMAAVSVDRHVAHPNVAL